MKKIRQILKEETSDPFTGVSEDLLIDFILEFNGNYDDKMAKQFCKYLNIDSWVENLSYFDELIKLNPISSFNSQILRPTKKEYQIIFEIKEKLYVKYDTVQKTYGYNLQSVEDQIGNGEISSYDGSEVMDSRETYDSDFLDENFFIEEIR